MQAIDLLNTSSERKTDFANKAIEKTLKKFKLT